jgi:hypothetical protein
VTTNIDILTVRRVLGRDVWSPPRPFGPDGWNLVRGDPEGSVIVTCADGEDGVEWVHASIAYADQMPSYEDLVLLHRAVWKGKGWAYQVFTPDSDHVNIHEHALHIWGRLDGSPVLPDFTRGSGSI